METEEFDRNVDEADEEPIEGSEIGIADEAGTDESELTGQDVDEELEDRGDA